MVRRPALTGFALGALGGVSLPIDVEVGQVIALTRAGLPTGIRTNGAQQVNPLAVLAADQDIAR
jgi:hypothetical protein